MTKRQVELVILKNPQHKGPKPQHIIYILGPHKCKHGPKGLRPGVTLMSYKVLITTLIDTNKYYHCPYLTLCPLQCVPFLLHFLVETIGLISFAGGENNGVYY